MVNIESESLLLYQEVVKAARRVTIWDDSDNDDEPRADMDLLRTALKRLDLHLHCPVCLARAFASNPDPDGGG